MQKKVAIIGSGISGLYAAYKLSQNNVVTLYEKENYIGGHTRTINVIENKRKIPIDTGFIVYNLINYPNFSEMLKELKVKSFKSNMSFAISGIKDEYKLSTLSTVFANKKNIFSFKYYKLIYEIIKFNSEALNMINKNVNTKINLRNYLRKHNYTEFFIKGYIVPMGSSIWSCNEDEILNYPLISYIQFMNNHGLLSIGEQLQWYSIEKGSNSYVSKMLNKNNFTVKKCHKVSKILRKNNKVKVFSKNKSNIYDACFICTHSNSALKLLGNSATSAEINYLKEFEYSNNSVCLHTDASVMPKNKKCWASWVYKANKYNRPLVSYWMNNLQKINSKKNYFVSLNSEKLINDDLMVNKTILQHPVFNYKTKLLQRDVGLIQGIGNIYYAGAYLGNGFHEDGINASINAMKYYRRYQNENY